jgi:hypothetical protein
MPVKYRMFEQDPITNMWFDRGWVEAASQQDALRQSANGNFHFVVPETSFHPARVAKVEVSRWEYVEDLSQLPMGEGEPVIVDGAVEE